MHGNLANAYHQVKHYFRISEFIPLPHQLWRVPPHKIPSLQAHLFQKGPKQYLISMNCTIIQRCGVIQIPSNLNVLLQVAKQSNQRAKACPGCHSCEFKNDFLISIMLIEECCDRNGRRQCLGMNFSLAEQRTLLPMLCKSIRQQPIHVFLFTFIHCSEKIRVEPS